MITRRNLLLPIIGSTLSFAAYGQQVTINGAGATFPAPLYFKWAEEYRKATGVNVNYQSIGSGAGINQARAGTVDFGATDMPIDPVPSNLFQFPTVEGEVVLIFNLPGINTMTTTVDMASRIYNGSVKTWNEVNSSLPRIPIIPIYRADGSGTTFIWTRAMEQYGQWQGGAGTSVRWPAGQGARGNEGVAATVQRTRGAVGYVEYIYAKNNNISHAQLDRRIRAKTYILVPLPTRPNHNHMIEFWRWCFTHGLPIAESMHYHPLTHDEYNTTLQRLESI